MEIPELTRPLTGRLLELWEGRNCTPEQAAAYRRLFLHLWGKQTAQQQSAPAARNRPCIHLGPVIDRLNCYCYLKWIHRCALHGQCRQGPSLHDDVMSCRTCPDYEAEKEDALAS